MTKENSLKQIQEAVEEGNFQILGKLLDQYLPLDTPLEISKNLSLIILNYYTTYKADTAAGLMELFISTSPQLALVQGGENFLFRVAVLKGSMELYECFMEEAIEPFLADKDADEQSEYISDLLSTAVQLNDLFFGKYVKAVKGMDFNGAFSRHETHSHIALINQEDFELMDEVVEKYNSIVGRRDLILALEAREALIEFE